MKATLKGAFSRPIQTACNVLTAICAYNLLPDNASAAQWTAYVFIWVSLLAHGFDSYKEGIEKGIQIMQVLEGKP